MAFAKEMTIATGHTVRVNGDEHEIKVSLTYELERNDHDVLLLAAVKAGEVQNAHKAACQQMHSLWTEREAFSDDEAPPMTDEDEEVFGNEDDQAFGDEEEPPATSVPVSFQPPPPAPALNGHATSAVGNGNTPKRGNGFARLKASDPTNNAQQPEETAQSSPGDDPATVPQKIAIRSLAKQAGLDETRLRDYLWDTFKTLRLDKLSKYQAARLMLAFQDGTWQSSIPGAQDAIPNITTTIH